MNRPHCSHHRVTWHWLIPADHEYLDSVAWPCHYCEVAPVWHHDVTNARTCQFFRRLFDRLPVRISTSDFHHRNLRKKNLSYQSLWFGVQFSFNFFCFKALEKNEKWHHLCAHAWWWSHWRPKNVEKRLLAPSNLTFLLMGVIRVQKGGDTEKRAKHEVRSYIDDFQVALSWE